MGLCTWRLHRGGGNLPKKSFESLTHLPPPLFTKTQIDVGLLPQGRPIDVSFPLANKTQDDVEIQDVRTSCGCTAAVASGVAYAAGHMGHLDVHVDTHQKSGPFSVQVLVSYARGVRVQSERLEVRGTASEDGKLLSAPSLCYLGDLEGGTVIDKVLKIRTIGRSHTSIVGVASSPSWLTIGVERLGSEWRAAVRGVVPLGGGRLVQNIEFSTDSADFPLLEVPIVVNVVGPVTIQPASMIWLVDGAPSGAECEVDSKYLPIDSIEFDSGAMPGNFVWRQHIMDGGKAVKIHLDAVHPIQDITSWTQGLKVSVARSTYRLKLDVTVMSTSHR